MPIKRGEIYFVSLDPVVGCELGGGKRRPVVVISIDILNTKPLVVMVAPGTKSSNQPRAFRNAARISPTAENGLVFPTSFQCHQLRALDHSRFMTAPVGRLSEAELDQLEAAIRFSLGLK